MAQSPALAQQFFPSLCPLAEAVEVLASSGIEERGAIYTRAEVVEFILDLVGYTPDKPIGQQRLLEPSFGGGEFLYAAVSRLIAAYRASKAPNFDQLLNALRAVEVHRETYNQTYAKLLAQLEGLKFSLREARALADTWLVRNDFLLAEHDGEFDYIVGNPPYVRQELIPQVLIDEYRRRFSTIYDRADIYVPFIEQSLAMLARGGVLSFICADRWMKNRYGGPLRKLVSERYHLRAYVDMVDTPAFLSEVVAYPAIFVIANEPGNTTRLAHRPKLDASTLKALATDINATVSQSAAVKEIPVAARGSEPWILEALDTLGLVRRLEAQYPTIEEAGCRVGIGVATGADKAFIGKFDELDVEPDRKVPIAMSKDLATGTLRWGGLGVINPFAPEGGLVRLEQYPKLKLYLEARKEQIARRHVAQKTPANWYRTIDRIYPELVGQPKLLIPDIRGEASIVYDEGACYPHHNLYFVTSANWDLRALQAVLLSGIARLFISTYSTKMRGGYLRFQAQYLRRIRIPNWSDLSMEQRAAVIAAGASKDPKLCNKAVADIYNLSEAESALLFDVGV
ncbi:modification methylase PaeR7I [Caulobacter vibrioides]|uniref:site-specific DNA-methyltransferase (adenine-specific) n=1 Tax=Caulobacter vibrioides TaxID=155892 RepID=A0A290MRN2_CAUVI|nr:Eco57I restriction-modification methylase domain-containing protein [Caulobacter vibrioides]ATC30995.1 modification methylase PaeR7I [Caulobacter vibrioides]